MENRDISFTAKAQISRLSTIQCKGHDIADNKKPLETKIKTYIFPKMSPSYLLEMEAESSIPCWGPSKTNSLRLTVETEQRRNEVKEIIAKWNLQGKMNIPPKYGKKCEILAVFTSFPMYLVGLKLFHDYLSEWDPLSDFKTLAILNCKSILTERSEICHKTGLQKKERQIIINRQLNVGPAMAYITDYITNENIREGIRYRVNYQKSSFEDELDALDSISIKFDHDHPSLNLRGNWLPTEGQSESGITRDYNHWMSDLMNHDSIYLDRLANQERAALIASRNKKPGQNLDNLKKIHNLETHSFARSASTLDENSTIGSFGRLEMGSISSRISSVKIIKKTRRKQTPVPTITNNKNPFLTNTVDEFFFNQPVKSAVDITQILDKSFVTMEPTNLNRVDLMHFQQKYHAATSSFADAESVVLEETTIEEATTSRTEYFQLPNNEPEN